MIEAEIYNAVATTKEPTKVIIARYGITYQKLLKIMQEEHARREKEDQLLRWAVGVLKECRRSL